MKGAGWRGGAQRGRWEDAPGVRSQLDWSRVTRRGRPAGGTRGAAKLRAPVGPQLSSSPPSTPGAAEGPGRS